MEIAAGRFIGKMNVCLCCYTLNRNLLNALIFFLNKFRKKYYYLDNKYLWGVLFQNDHLVFPIMLPSFSLDFPIDISGDDDKLSQGFLGGRY